MNEPQLQPLPAPHAWMEFAACTGVFTELFFYSAKTGHSEADVRAGLDICNRCPVTSQCLQFAFDTDDQFAVLGGTTPAQRRLIQRKEIA